MSVLAYPTDIPAETLQLVIDALRGTPNVPKDAHALWHVIGYGLGKLLPDQLVVASGAPRAQAISEAQAADHLACMLPDVQYGQVATTAAVLPWGLILPVLFQLALKWLGG